MAIARNAHGARLLLLVALLTLSACARPAEPAGPASSAGSYIVQAASADGAAAAVAGVGGKVTKRLGIIESVAADLTADQAARLRSDRSLHVFADAVVRAADAPPRPSLTGTSRRNQETDTQGYLLYPAAATGVHTLRSAPVATPNLACQNRQVVDQTGQSSKPLLGWSVTVAVIDSGFMAFQNVSRWDNYDPATNTLYAENTAEKRCIVYRDFLPPQNSGAGVKPNSTDASGHATHIVATIADGRTDTLAPNQAPTPVGIAPKVNLFIARVLDKDGSGTYSGVIDAIQWVLDNQSAYRIRILNLSLQAPVTGPYWADPLNQAVMRAWQSGLVVVAAAGNVGADAGTITAPGNVPYVITVGAVRSGRYNPSNMDELAGYSSRGPTESAFIKPDVVVPASRTIAPMPDTSTLALDLEQECAAHPSGPVPCIQTKADADFGFGLPLVQHSYFYLSGTSMAAAEVSGIAALILQVSPGLTNNEVKGRILGTARPARDGAGALRYSPWEQGAGLVDAEAAIFAAGQTAANQGLDLTTDLNFSQSPQVHYWGSTTWDPATGNFSVTDPQTGQVLAVWSGGSRIWSGGTDVWDSGSRIWSGGSRIWSGGSRIWSGGASTWAGSDSLWAGGSRIWSGSTPITSVDAPSHSDIVLSIPDSICDLSAKGCAMLPLVVK